MSNTNYFLLRRLHSLLGIFPLGVFLINHLLTNSTSMVSAKFFEEKVALIHALGPILPIVEALFIFIPLALHIAIGIYIATQARIEVGPSMPYRRNWAFAFQRWTGWIAVIFIAYHVIHLRFLHDSAVEPFSVVLGRMFTEAWMIPYILFYLVGGAAVVFHFANGICTFCMTWGITVGPNSQRYMAYMASGVGAALMLMLVTSIFAFNKIGREYAAMSPEGQRAFVAELRAVHHNPEPHPVEIDVLQPIKP